METMLIEFWYWWVLAVFLLGIELLVTGFYFLWFALSAFFVGCWVWILPSVSFAVQILVFSILAIVSVSIWRIYFKKFPIATDQPLLNRRGAQYIGRVVTLIEPIRNGQGKIKVDDSLWKVQGEDCPIDTRVKIVGIKSTIFEVEKVET